MMVLEGGAADGILEVGDKIREIDGMPLTESGLFFDLIADKKMGDQVEIRWKEIKIHDVHNHVERDSE